MKVKLKAWEIIDHGVDHSQYFAGGSTKFSDFKEALTGSGNSCQEALTHALALLSEECILPPELLNKVSEADASNQVILKIKETLPSLKFKVIHKSETMGIYHEEEFKELIDAQAYLRNRINEFKSKFGAEVINVGPDYFQIHPLDQAGIIPDWSGTLEILSNEERIKELQTEALEKNELKYFVSIRYTKLKQKS